MKKIIPFFVALMFSTTFLSAQTTATNFTMPDCNGVNHTLFDELDAGKVIVIDWVMPCITCIPYSKTTYNVVQSYQSSHPNRVFFYMVDDYGQANSDCAVLNSWGNTNGMPASASSLRFENKDTIINMLDYGSKGMPKIVVLGGTSHTVFYNSNNTVNATALQTAINDALNTGASISEPLNSFASVSIYPNPANATSAISFNLKKSSVVKTEVFNQVGQKVIDMSSGNLPSGENKIQLNTTKLNDGIYFLKISNTDHSSVVKLTVAH